MPTRPIFRVISVVDGYVIDAVWSDGTFERLVGLYETEEAAQTWVDKGGGARWLLQRQASLPQQ